MRETLVTLSTATPCHAAERSPLDDGDGSRRRVEDRIRDVYLQTCDAVELPQFSEQRGTGPTAVHCREAHERFAGSGWRKSWGDPMALGGAKNYADVLATFRQGWAEGADKASRLAHGLDSSIPGAKSRRRRRIVGEDGADVLEEAWLDRDYDRMFSSYRRDECEGPKILRLGFLWGVNCQTTGEEMFWTGAAALVLTDVLESAGYAVELVAFQMTRPLWSEDADKGNLQVTAITVKPADQPVSPPDVAAVLCHAGVYRTFGFDALARAPWNHSSGLGRTVDGEAVLAQLATDGHLEPLTCFVRAAYSEGAARKEIIRILQTVQPTGDSLGR